MYGFIIPETVRLQATFQRGGMKQGMIHTRMRGGRRPCPRRSPVLAVHTWHYSCSPRQVLCFASMRRNIASQTSPLFIIGGVPIR